MLNYRKRNLWKAFVDFLFDNDGKVASSYKHTHIKARVQKNIHYLWPKWPKSAKIDTLFMNKTAEKTVPFGMTHTYTAHIREYLPPPPVFFGPGH